MAGNISGDRLTIPKNDDTNKFVVELFIKVKTGQMQTDETCVYFLNGRMIYRNAMTVH
jgi:hypothetical protein